MVMEIMENTRKLGLKLSRLKQRWCELMLGKITNQNKRNRHSCVCVNNSQLGQKRRWWRKNSK